MTRHRRLEAPRRSPSAPRRPTAGASALALPLCLSLLATGCGGGGPAVDIAAEESAVRERALAWAEAEASNDVDSALAFMWEDAVMQPPGAPQVEGIEAIRGLYEAVTFLSLEVGPLTVKVGSGGDLAAVWGPLDYELEGPEGRVADEGKFVAVWERRNGVWKVVENTWNSDAPPGEGAGAEEGAESVSNDTEEFAARYARAWSGGDPAAVAAFFAPDGSLAVNDGAPAVGRAAITEVARGFMTTFPDMVVTMDRLVRRGETVEFHWTLAGTNTGPGGTGNRVEISGHEAWTMDEDGLIAASDGHFDAEEYERQLAEGVDR